MRYLGISQLRMVSRIFQLFIVFAVMEVLGCIGVYFLGIWGYYYYFTFYCLPVDISKDTYKIVFTIANVKIMLLWSVREKE